MVNFAKLTDTLTREGICYNLFENGGVKSLSYHRNGKFYNQLYDEAEKLISYTIENPETYEKITADIERIGNNYTSIYKTKQCPMGYFTRDIKISKNNEYKGYTWDEITSVKKDTMGQVLEEMKMTYSKGADGYYDGTIETINSIGQRNSRDFRVSPQYKDDYYAECAKAHEKWKLAEKIKETVNDTCSSTNKHNNKSSHYYGVTNVNFDIRSILGK